MNKTIKGIRQGSAPVPLSLLDFAITGKGQSVTEAYDTSINLARLADQRGFSRYWIAEHHAMPGVATSSPAVMLSRLISETSRIRLGSGGMMLPNFPPLVVAEQFSLLAALAPGRIDLGIGRAPGTDGMTASALRRGQTGEEAFPEQIQELFHFLEDSFPDGHPYKGNVYVVPGVAQDRENGVPGSFAAPDIWLLGSSGYSARLAGQMGLPFGFAAQLAPENMMMALNIYRKHFRPSALLNKPYVLVCFGVFAADSNTEAAREVQSYAHAMMRMMYRQSYVLPSPQELEHYSYTHPERRMLDTWKEKVLYGTGQQVVDKLNHYQSVSGADELMILNLGYTPDALVHSAGLIADAYEMPVNTIRAD
ncbi:LLM class flavin-dependent oxidoreductase [Enterobacter cloacae]|uniref:LLM class flavin-dependent oxidoreductase n=1 Tax=Enterobacter cloacae TaxID=550 RepID=UPI003754C5CB